MVFIIRMLGKFIFIVTVSFCCSLLNAAEKSPYLKYVNEILDRFVKEMKTLGFHCWSDSGEMPFDVVTIGLSFNVYEKGSIESGREKIIFLTEKLLEAINKNEGIRPYLRDYPFTPTNISMAIYFRKQNYEYYNDGSINKINNVWGKVFYKIHSETPVDTVILEEKYEDSLRLTNRQDPRAFKTDKNLTTKQIKPSKQRLGHLPINLNGLGPGQEFEALGIRDRVKDAAEDIGEIIGGVCDLHFGEEFLEKLAQYSKENRNGEFVDYWENGQIKAKVPFKEGKLESHIHGWYPDGLIAFKGFYKEGKRVGIQIAFYPIKGSNRIGRLLEYDLEGKLHGTQKTKSPELHLLSIIEYKHGILHGETTFYNNKRSSPIIGEWDYKDGKLAKVTVNSKDVVTKLKQNEKS